MVLETPTLSVIEKGLGYSFELTGTGLSKQDNDSGTVNTWDLMKLNSFCMVSVFLVIFFFFFCLFSKEKGVVLDGLLVDMGGDEGGKRVTRIYCMKMFI